MEYYATPPLPDDVLVEILQFLPAKSVLRFRAVCKPWCRLLSDPAFIHEHHRRAPRGILLRNSYTGTGAISVLPFPCTDLSTAVPLHCGTTARETLLHGCCDGLLLFSCRCLGPPELDVNGFRYDHFVCNPATQERARLPVDLPYVNFSGFYLHAPTAEYRVLCYIYVERHYKYFVAVPGQHQARKLQRDRDNMIWGLNSTPVIHLGCLHWMLWCPSMGVVVFDMISEEFRRIRGPVDGDPQMGRIIRGGKVIRVDGTLGAWLFDNTEVLLKVWVLDNYEEQAWILRYKVDVSFLNSSPLGCIIEIAHVSDEGDAVLLSTWGKRCGVYNLRRREVVSVGNKSFRGELHATSHVYKESLVALIQEGVGSQRLGSSAWSSTT